MALKKSDSKETTTQTQSSLSPQLMSQFENNFSSSLETSNSENADTKSAKKPNYKNIFNVHMASGDKARLKVFCAEREVPINSFILFAIEHLIDEVEEGKYSVSKSGIRNLKKEI